MTVAKVVGSVVSTNKNDKLIGCKFMILEPYYSPGKKNRFVAVDNVGAGIGEVVLVTTGSSARTGCGWDNAPIDAAIVGIIDTCSDLE